MRIRSIAVTAFAVAVTAGFMGAAAHAVAPTQQPRVVGGAPIGISQAPWQVLISVRGQEFCGGSLLNATWAVTAAHCFDRVTSPAEVQVFAGTDLLTAGPAGAAVRRSATGIVTHPAWDRATYANDIALVALNEPVLAGPTIGTISLPGNLPSVDPAWPAAGTPATIIGWGATRYDGAASEQLQRGDVTVLSNPGDAICGAYGGRYDPNTQLCAGLPQGGVDSCQGDSGGALAIQRPEGWVLAGISSTGIECALAEYPGIYTRVTSFDPWIRSIVGPLGMVPAAPEAVQARSPRAGRVRISWQPPAADGNRPIVEYRATARGKSCRTSGTSCLIRGLPRDRAVVVRVQAVNEVGAGASAQTRIRVR